MDVYHYDVFLRQLPGSTVYNFSFFAELLLQYNIK